MIRIPTLLTCLMAACLVQAQTYFYIGQIAVSPAAPTTTDNVDIQLIGALSDTGAGVDVTAVEVAGSTVHITLVASSMGGATVIVPHTETIALGQLAAGTYTIVCTEASTGIDDLAPPEQHLFTVSGGGSPCDDLQIAVQWHAFTDTAVVVHVGGIEP